MGKKELNNTEIKSLEQCLEELKKVNETLDFAEKSWRDASQANALMAGKIQKLEKELEKEKEQQDILKDLLKEQERQTGVWREAYETVVNSKTWKAANKVKHVFGKKQ